MKASNLVELPHSWFSQLKNYSGNWDCALNKYKAALEKSLRETAVLRLQIRHIENQKRKA